MLTIDPRSTKPIYEQIIDGIRESLLKGQLSPGDKIPSVRELSRLLTINPNTVGKAYAELERQKIIETLVGKGTYISATYKPKADEDRLQKIRHSLKDIIVEAHYLGLKQDELIDMLNESYKEIERK